MDKVDLFIPTYNRPGFLKRILDYYNLYNVGFNIIVADSSSIKNRKINSKIVTEYPKLKILYIDKFSDKIISHRKFAEMVKYAKNKYCVICADDDFILPTGIEKAVSFLEKNPDYSCAHGTYIAFYVNKKFLWKFIYPFKSITSSMAEKRLTTHFINYEQVLYSVRRTQVVKDCYREFLKFGIDPVFFGELLPDMLTVIYGKMKRIDTLYAARQAFSSSSDYWPSLLDAKKIGIYDREYSKFKSCLIYNLVKKSNISTQKAEQNIDSNIENYLKYTAQQHLLGKINFLLNSLPAFIANIFRRLHILYLFSKDKQGKIGLIDKPTSKYFTDFNNIKKAVLNN